MNASVEFLVYRIDSTGLHTISKKVENIQGAPVPVNVSLLATSNASVESSFKINHAHTVSGRGPRQSAIAGFFKFRRCEVCILLSIPEYGTDNPIYVNTFAADRGL